MNKRTLIMRSLSKTILAFLFISLHTSITAKNTLAVKIDTIRPILNKPKTSYFLSIPYCTVKHPKVALVLSGGGVRGISAIGVIRTLEKHNIPIDIIIGTSIGSVIGALYAMGYSTDQLQCIVDTTNWDNILRLTDEVRRSDMFLDQKITREKSIFVLRFKGLVPVIPEAFSTGQKLTRFLNILTLNALYKPIKDYDDFRIPFRAVTTDLITGKRIVIKDGDVTETLRASIAVPLLFTSVPRDTLLLLDGGLIDNIPVDVAIEEHADIIIAVDMVSPLRPKNKLTAPWEIADQITTIMMQEAVNLSRKRADIVIKPKLGDKLPSDYSGIDSLILLGEQAAEDSIPKIKQIIEQRLFEIYNNNEQFKNNDVYYKPTFVINNQLDTCFESRIRFYENRGYVLKSELQILVNDIYATGNNTKVESIVHSTRDSAEIQIDLIPNPPIRKVSISGNNIITTDTLVLQFANLIDKPFNLKEITSSIENVLTLYRKLGYPLAKIYDSRFDSLKGNLELFIDEGTVSRTEIIGATKTRHWVIRRELPWQSNNLVTSYHLDKAISNLYGTSFFDQVRLSVQREASNKKSNTIVIHTHERSTELVRIGLRIDNERNIQPSIDIRDENLLGAAAEIGLFIGGGIRNQSYIAEAKSIRIFHSYFTFTLRGFYLSRDMNYYTDVFKVNTYNFTREKLGEYREIRSGGLLSLGTQLERLGNFTIEGRLERHRLLNILNNPVSDDAYNISSIRFGINLDTQDKVPFPTDGMVLNCFYESALIKLFKAIGYTKMYFSYETYASTGKHTFRPKIILGVADETLPFAEQFSFGGQHNFFGYHENDFRGRNLTILSLEYQYLLPFSIFFDTFLKIRYDFGTISSHAKEMRLNEFKHGVGTTIGLDTPIGPAEFSIGRSFCIRNDLSNKPLGFGPFMLYFSIGYPITGVVRN